MNIAIIGAASGIGLEAIRQALYKGHRVVAFSLDTSTIPPHSLLTKIDGSAISVNDLKKAMANTDAVLITVGTKKKKGTSLFSDIAKALIRATEEIDYKNPVLIITGFGAGDSKPYLNFFMKMVIRLFLKDQYIDKDLMEELITKSSMNWEIIRPGILGNGPNKEGYRIFTQLEQGMKVGKVNRIDVADYMVAEAEKKINLLKKVTIS
jgi:putative NADH-flavin reductase